MGPEQRPEVANAMLAFMASEGRDLANMLAKANNKTLNLSALDARLARAHALYIPDTDEAGNSNGD